jgi:hypothetical protein
MHLSQSIVYFEREGRENLSEVIRIVKRAFKKRVDLRSSKIVVFTAIGQGAAMAYNILEEYEPTIIAVTFPLDFSIPRGDKRFFPRIPEKLQAFFDALKIKVITTRLPFDEIDGAVEHNAQMKMIKDVLSLFGGSFPQCIQAVLQACDAGAIVPGEKVISITGDVAAVITASTTRAFLSREAGLVISEILCKPRNLNIARGDLLKAAETSSAVITQTSFALKGNKQKELPKIINATRVEEK